MSNPSRIVEIRSSSGEVALMRIIGHSMTSSKCIEILPETTLEYANSDQSLAELDKALQDLQDLDALPGLANQS